MYKTYEYHDDSFKFLVIILIVVSLSATLITLVPNSISEYQPTPGGKKSDSNDRARLIEWNNFAKLHKLQPITIDQAVLLEDRDVARMELAVLARENEASIVNSTDYVTHPAGKGSVTRDE